MIKKSFPILLLASTYFIGQLYVFFSTTEVSNWILFKSTPMVDAWNMKYLSEEINRTIEAVAFAMMLKKADDAYRLVAYEYILYRVVDIFSYFYDFKTNSYWIILFLLGIIFAILFIKHRNEKTNNAW
jgi:hypothetical protein